MSMRASLTILRKERQPHNYKSTYLGSEYSTRTQGFDYQNGWKLNDSDTLIAGGEYHWSDSSNVEGAGYEYVGIK